MDKNNTAVTYRQAIQDIQHKLDKIFDSIESLRDCASLEEKSYWNDTRRDLNKIGDRLSELDDKLSKGRASMPIDEYYL